MNQALRIFLSTLLVTGLLGPMPRAYAADELDPLDLADLEDAENRARGERANLTLQIAGLATIASGVTVVRSVQLKRQSEALLKNFDEIKRTEALRNVLDDINNSQEQVDYIGMRLGPDREELARLEAATPIDADRVARKKQAIELLEQSLEKEKRRLAEWGPKAAELKTKLELPETHTRADVIRDLDNKRTAFSQKLASVQSLDEFKETLGKLRAGNIALDSASELPDAVTRRRAQLAAKSKLLRRLGILGLSASAITSTVAAFNTYNEADVTTARERVIAGEFEEMQNALEHGTGDGAIELPPPEHVLQETP